MALICRWRVRYDLAPPMPMEGEDPMVVNGFRQFTKLCEILTEITRTMVRIFDGLVRVRGELIFDMVVVSLSTIVCDRTQV